MTEDPYLCRASTSVPSIHASSEARHCCRAVGDSALIRRVCIRIIPHVDCTPRIRELARYCMEGVIVNGACAGPAAIQLFDHVLCDMSRLPVREVVSVTHYVTDPTLGLGEVVFPYLKEV
jgi:acetoacetate decarboxylase